MRVYVISKFEDDPFVKLLKKTSGLALISLFEASLNLFDFFI